MASEKPVAKPQPTTPLKAFIRSFGYAFQGLAYALRTQRNLRVHALAVLLVVPLGLWLRLPLVHWAFLVLTMGAVWAAELFNTALEALTDLASPNPHPLAKVAKDTAAAAVLITAITALIMACLLLAPPLALKLGIG